MKIEFGNLDLEQMANEDKRVNQEQVFLDQFAKTPKGAGSFVLRPLPPVSGGKLFHATRIHSINGRKVHCPRPVVNGKWDRNVCCPICEYYTSLWKQSDKLVAEGKTAEAEVLKTEARKIKPVERYYYNAIVRKHVNKDGEVEVNVGPRVWSIGKSVHGMIVKAIIGDGDDRIGDVTHVINGHDFILKTEMKGEYPNYDSSSFAREPSPLGTPEEIERWSQSMHDLTKFRNIKPVEELERELMIHRGVIPDTDGFDIAAIEAKFRQGDGRHAEPTVTNESAVPSTSEASISNDAEVDTDDFIKEINEMRDEMGMN